MGDILIELQMASQVHMPTHEHISLCGQAADEIVRLREELGDLEAYAAAWTDTANRYARDADRWKADADRLAEQVVRLMCACEPGNIYYRCSKCLALDLHDKEVEAR